MGKYNKITDFIPRFKENPTSIGRQLGEFMKIVYTFMRENHQYELANYGEVLSKNDIEWEIDSMSTLDYSTADEQCILALLVGAVRAEDFCDGEMLIQFQQNGSLVRWLERLKELDKQGE